MLLFFILAPIRYRYTYKNSQYMVFLITDPIICTTLNRIKTDVSSYAVYTMQLWMRHHHTNMNNVYVHVFSHIRVKASQPIQVSVADTVFTAP